MDNEFVHMALKGETYCSIFGYTAKHQTWWLELLDHNRQFDGSLVFPLADVLLRCGYQKVSTWYFVELLQL
jgi:hypothetical protein